MMAYNGSNLASDPHFKGIPYYCTRVELKQILNLCYVLIVCHHLVSKSVFERKLTYELHWLTYSHTNFQPEIQLTYSDVH